MNKINYLTESELSNNEMIKPNSIILGNSLNIIKQLPSKSINAIITDPPYCISRNSGFACKSSKEEYNKKYGKYVIDFGEWDKDEIDLQSFLTEFYRILKDGGSLICFYDIWKIQKFKAIAEEVGFKQPRVCLWVKTNPVPVNSKLNYLSNSKECFLTFTKKSKPTFNSEYNRGLFYYPICSGSERTAHPTQKPLKLMEEILQIHSNENDIILDPFMGSGTTGVACKNTSRRFIGIEIYEKYFNLAKERLSND